MFIHLKIIVKILSSTFSNYYYLLKCLEYKFLKVIHEHKCHELVPIVLIFFFTSFSTIYIFCRLVRGVWLWKSKQLKIYICLLLVVEPLTSLINVDSEAFLSLFMSTSCYVFHYSAEEDSSEEENLYTCFTN